MINNDFLLVAIRDKKTQLLSNIVQSRNEVELERDLFRMCKNPNSPYKDFEKEYEIVILGQYNLLTGLSDTDMYVYKSLDEVKNLNMNDKEVLKNE